VRAILSIFVSPPYIVFIRLTTGVRPIRYAKIYIALLKNIHCHSNCKERIGWITTWIRHLCWNSVFQGWQESNIFQHWFQNFHTCMFHSSWSLFKTGLVRSGVHHHHNDNQNTWWLDQPLKVKHEMHLFCYLEKKYVATKYLTSKRKLKWLLINSKIFLITVYLSCLSFILAWKFWSRSNISFELILKKPY
jgi:hypothetical protein